MKFVGAVGCWNILGGLRHRTFANLSFIILVVARLNI